MQCPVSFSIMAMPTSLPVPRFSSTAQIHALAGRPPSVEAAVVGLPVVGRALLPVTGRVAVEALAEPVRLLRGASSEVDDESLLSSRRFSRGPAVAELELASERNAEAGREAGRPAARPSEGPEVWPCSDAAPCDEARPVRLADDAAWTLGRLGIRKADRASGSAAGRDTRARASSSDCILKLPGIRRRRESGEGVVVERAPRKMTAVGRQKCSRCERDIDIEVEVSSRRLGLRAVLRAAPATRARPCASRRARASGCAALRLPSPAPLCLAHHARAGHWCVARPAQSACGRSRLVS